MLRLWSVGFGIIWFLFNRLHGTLKQELCCRENVSSTAGQRSFLQSATGKMLMAKRFEREIKDKLLWRKAKTAEMITEQVNKSITLITVSTVTDTHWQAKNYWGLIPGPCQLRPAGAIKAWFSFLSPASLTFKLDAKIVGLTLALTCLVNVFIHLQQSLLGVKRQCSNSGWSLWGEPWPQSSRAKGNLSFPVEENGISSGTKSKAQSSLPRSVKTCQRCSKKTNKQ